MFRFSLPTTIESAGSFGEFAERAQLAADDLILTNQFIYEPFIEACGVPCPVLYQEKYGAGEPNDEMIDAIRRDIPESTRRIIAVGGGTVIDIAKVLTFTGDWSAEDIFMGRVVPTKSRRLVVLPTTCGTGSEVTNVTICELKRMKTKKGLALDTMYADLAVLIPEMLQTLPYQFFATSSIDALIHAVESFLSPNASPHSEMYSRRAMEMILQGFSYVRENGPESWKDKVEDFLLASNMAGIAFGHAGCAAVHALSYPLGGAYHIPHGEANQLMFAAVMRRYKEKEPVGRINRLEEIFGEILKTDAVQALDALYDLMEDILKRKDLREYGIREEELPVFTDSVIEGQQRLLKNNYVFLTREDMLEIYRSCY